MTQQTKILQPIQTPEIQRAPVPLAEQDTFMTPAGDPAIENFKNAGKLTAIALLGAAQTLPMIGTRKREATIPSPTAPIFGPAALTAGTLGAVKEVRVGMAKRRASR